MTLRVAPAARPPWRDRLADRAALATVLLALCVPLGWLGDWWWPLALIQHFPVHQAAIALLLAGMLAWARWWKWCAVAGALALWCAGWAAAPSWGSPPKAPEEALRLNLLVANLNVANDDPRLGEWIARQGADIVILIECAPRHIAAVRTRLDASHPHQRLMPRTDAFGIAVFSTRPFAAQTHRMIHGGVPMLDLAWNDPAWRLLAAHPVPPIYGDLAAEQRLQLQDIAAAAATSTGALIIAGDLNLTPWATGFRRLLHETDTRDSRIGHGLQASWPTWLGPCGIPIDHVLLRGAIAEQRRTMAVPGSDHRAVLIGIAIPRSAIAQ